MRWTALVWGAVALFVVCVTKFAFGNEVLRFAGDLTAAEFATYDVATLQNAVLLIVVCVLAQPLFLVSPCGNKFIGLHSAQLSRGSAVTAAHNLYERLRGCTVACESFLVGQATKSVRVVAAPLAALPRAATVAVTHAQRRKLLAGGAAVAWLSYAALSGLGVAELVGATLVKVMSFVQPENALSAMDRSFRVGEALFKFGEFEMAGVAIRPPTRTVSRDFSRQE